MATNEQKEKAIRWALRECHREMGIMDAKGEPDEELKYFSDGLYAIREDLRQLDYLRQIMRNILNAED